MNYFYSITDDNGFIHSIDNVVYIYLIKNYNMERVAQELIAIRKDNNSTGWENLNCSCCNKYSWYQNIVHIGAIHISFGKYGDYDKTNRSYVVYPLLRLEVNPNKHYDEQVFQDIVTWIRKNCTSGKLQKYDYAIDVPFNISKVKVFNSRKEPGLFKGTVYRGQRSQHGFLKIYDKAKELEIHDNLTRIEHTLFAEKTPSLEKISVFAPDLPSPSAEKLDNLNECIVMLCLEIQASGKDFEQYISKLNYRRRKKINPYLYGGALELKYDMEILRTLLEKIDDLFDADQQTELPTDGFVEITDLNELPFN